MLLMNHWPIFPKPQTISDAITTNVHTMAMMVTTAAKSFGILPCNQLCSGHTTAMMNRAKATGARMDFAKYSAASSSTAVQSPSMAFTAHSPSLRLRPNG